MEIDFNSKPHFGYLGSDEIETLMSNNILTIKPKKSIFKQSIGGMGLIAVSYTHLTLPTNREV